MEALSLQLDKGRFFSKAYATDTLSIVLNESAVTAMGIQGNPVGARLTTPDGQLNARDGSQYIYTVAGVVKDFHFSPLQELIGPLAMYPRDENFSRITLKTDVAKPAEVAAWVEKTWKKHFPTALLDFDFSDAMVEQQYQAEKRFARIFLCFSVYRC